jgi:carbamoyl-phosphate synthase large subunit
MGGQTALNLCLEAEKRIWADFSKKMIGVDVNAINIPKIESSSNNYLKINVPSAPAEICTSYLRGKVAQEFGFPVIRPSFTLGGTGSCNCV